ncbi:hypothetical protein QYE76_013440 [Lolium multiflorum]|uniref:Reverse transcriptase Ty1/copia-type domain-containing protein n=1 Tax=Lolium multiflorum TaxID=4521 RepID=A0AAD8U2L0_LOLMU|nr:hypothetical protein QYE76_013440 [Lolium multiflorum]
MASGRRTPYRPRRNKGPRHRLIEECNLVHHALSCAEHVKHDTEPATYTEAVASVDRVKWISAMQEEMQSLDKNGTWDVVPLPKQKKDVRCIDYNDVFSPVVKHSSIRAFFGIVAMHDLELEQLDVKIAFLHGELEDEIYMDQPEGFVVPGKEDLVCKFKRSLYGLKQSARQWYKMFDSFMIAHKFKRSQYDSCVYIKFVNGSPIYLLLYVDDMLIAAKSKKEITTLESQLSSAFEMKDLGAAKKILALQCPSTDGDIEYISRVPYSSAVGSLMVEQEDDFLKSLVNTLERVALRVVQETSGPALWTHQGEIPFYTRPPLPYTLAAPQQQGSPAYVVYKVEGDPGDYQFLFEPPKEIPHGYVCTYVRCADAYEPDNGRRDCWSGEDSGTEGVRSRC